MWCILYGKDKGHIRASHALALYHFSDADVPSAGLTAKQEVEVPVDVVKSDEATTGFRTLASLLGPARAKVLITVWVTLCRAGGVYFRQNDNGDVFIIHNKLPSDIILSKKFERRWTANGVAEQGFRRDRSEWSTSVSSHLRPGERMDVTVGRSAGKPQPFLPSKHTIEFRKRRGIADMVVLSSRTKLAT